MENKAAEIYYCEGCGGVMQFDIARQAFCCPNCGNEISLIREDAKVEEHDFEAYLQQSDSVEWAGETEVWRCESCGAEIVVQHDATTANCAYCGSSHVLKARQGEGIRPEAIVPFCIDRHEVGERFRKWIKGKWFAPGILKNIYQQDKLQAVYLPYWTYDANADARYTGQGGRVHYVTVGTGKDRHQERRVTWYFVSGTVGKFFDDVLVSAKKEQDALEKKASVFTTQACVPFDMAYLSGFQAAKYTLSAKDGYQEARSLMEQELRNMAHQQILQRYDEARVHSLSAQFRNVKFKHMLLPMWMSGYQYQNKAYRFLVNGQTGRVTGKYPKSKLKVAIAVLVLLALAVLLFMWLGERI